MKTALEYIYNAPFFVHGFWDKFKDAVSFRFTNIWVLISGNKPNINGDKPLALYIRFFDTLYQQRFLSLIVTLLKLKLVQIRQTSLLFLTRFEMYIYTHKHYFLNACSSKFGICNIEGTEPVFFNYVLKKFHILEMNKNTQIINW